MSKEALLALCAPIAEAVKKLDLADPAAAEAALNAAFPPNGDAVLAIARGFREGLQAGWLCDRENAGVKFSRVKKGAPGEISIDAVHMQGPGAGHLHPHGEVDLCFAVSGAPRFDGRAPGWTVYAPGTWHVHTVDGGAMDILYFLPDGAITFGPRPS